MGRRGLWALAATFGIVFMVVTVSVALFQEDIGWGWWWVVPVGVAFVCAVLGLRVLVQRSQDAAERADRELDLEEGA